MTLEYIAKDAIVELVKDSDYMKTVLEFMDCLQIEKVSRSRHGEPGWLHDRASQMVVMMAPSGFTDVLEELKVAGAIERSGKHWKITDAGIRAYDTLCN